LAEVYLETSSYLVGRNLDSLRRNINEMFGSSVFFVIPRDASLSTLYVREGSPGLRYP